MASFTGSTAIPYLEDNMGSVIPYRFAPNYTMCHVGVNDLFRPTGGHLLFKHVKPNHMKRKIRTKEYTDVITLGELDDILTGTKGRAMEMYRDSLIDGEDHYPSLIKIVQNVRAFGVSSISQCKDWHKDFVTTAQPVLIGGACYTDKTEFSKQDTLKIPIDRCEIIENSPQNPRQFVYMTLEKNTCKQWRPRFLITPKSRWINDDMLETEGMSLVYPLGIVDYVNLGQDNTSIYMFKPSPAMGGKPEDAVWMIEGFVFNPLASWVLTYKENPLDFYLPDSTTSNLSLTYGPRGILLPYDPVAKNWIPWFVKVAAYIKEKSKEEEEEEEDTDDISSMLTTDMSGKRKYFGDSGISESKYPRLSLDSGDTDFKDRYEHLSPSMRPNVNVVSNNTPPLFFTLNRSITKPRQIPPHLLQAITRPFQQITNINNIMISLNNYVEKEMKGGYKSIVMYRLQKETSITVSAKDAFLILAMSFLGRLRVTGTGCREAAEQINMNELFNNSKIEKLKCLINYFVKGQTFKAFLGDRKLTFYHKGISTIVVDQIIYPPLVLLEGPPKIEDVSGAIHADFANKRFGGGVLGNGAVQEEILLITHPEAILGRALFDTMSDKSACVVIGAVRVSKYKGYGSGGRFKANAFAYTGTVQYDPNQPMDTTGRALTEILAFDAINFKKRALTHQYTRESITREYKKALAAFSGHRFTDQKAVIVTGMWGSGAFGGDSVLKVLLQAVAACATNRQLIMVMLGGRVKTHVERILNEAQNLGVSAQTFLDIIIDTLGQNTYGFHQKTNSDITANSIIRKLNELRGTQQQQQMSACDLPPFSFTSPPTPPIYQKDETTFKTYQTEEEESEAEAREERDQEQQEEEKEEKEEEEEEEEKTNTESEDQDTVGKPQRRRKKKKKNKFVAE